MILYRQARKGGFLKINKKFMSKLSQYFADTREEMKHVSWPTRKQTLIFMILVIVISVVVSAYLGLFDWIFSTGLKSIVF